MQLTGYVKNAILVGDTPQERADAIAFFLTAADHCLVALQNFDTLAAILYAIQSTVVQRMQRTIDSVSCERKKTIPVAINLI